MIFRREAVRINVLPRTKFVQDDPDYAPSFAVVNFKNVLYDLIHVTNYRHIQRYKPEEPNGPHHNPPEHTKTYWTLLGPTRAKNLTSPL